MKQNVLICDRGYCNYLCFDPLSGTNCGGTKDIMFLETFNYTLKSTKREEFIQITQDIDSILKKSGIIDGWAKIFCPHTTAALTINQNANPDVVHDLGTMLHIQVPKRRLLNVEGNSDAHFKSSMMGVHLEIPIDNGTLSLGNWQGIFFCEFDGPRSRNIIVQIFGQDKE